MKQVNTREVQLNISTLLKELPFEIVKRGEVVALVSDPSEVSKLNEQLRLAHKLDLELMTEPISEPEKTTFGKCMNPFCKYEGELTQGESRGAWNDQIGEYEVLKGFFCPKHLT